MNSDLMRGQFGSEASVQTPVGLRSVRWLAEARRKALLICAGLIAAVGAGFLAERFLWATPTVSTDDAYVQGVIAHVTPQIDGVVASVYVHDTQLVRRGQLLARIDDSDARIEVDAAQADYDKANRQAVQDAAVIKAAEELVLAKQSEVDRAKQNYDRRARVAGSGAVSGEEVTDAKTAYMNTQYELAIAQQQLLEKKAVVDVTDLQHSPEVLSAKAALDKALLHLARTEIVAPINGVVADLHLEVGQQVARGISLMSLAPASNLYVDANFKEDQLSDIKPGQMVTLTSDVYGRDVIYHGTVEGVGGGTGAVFSIIPPQNATGNWIKIIQRLPVRIALDQQDVERHPLRMGISMNVTIDTNSSTQYATVQPGPGLRMDTFSSTDPSALASATNPNSAVPAQP